MRHDERRNLMKITADTRPADIESLSLYKDYLMYKVVPEDRPAVEMTLAEMQKDQPTWNIESMIRGLEHLDRLASANNIMYDVYRPEECEDDPEKKDVKVFYLPADQQPSNKPFVLLISGGAYTCVCSIVESFPSAARLNELGYNCFVLNYRVMQDKLLPKPEQDVAAALRFILDHKEQFNLVNDSYIVSGFSAGANVTVIWGTEANGWKKYGLPAPKAMFTIYPVISSEYNYPAARDWFLTMMFGKGYDMATVKSFDIPETFTSAYPPCYIVHAKDDPMVPVRNSIELKVLLDQENIPAELELIETGGHGWGDGSGTDAAGWIDRAAAFSENL